MTTFAGVRRGYAQEHADALLLVQRCQGRRVACLGHVVTTDAKAQTERLALVSARRSSESEKASAFLLLSAIVPRAPYEWMPLAASLVSWAPRRLVNCFTNAQLSTTRCAGQRHRVGMDAVPSVPFPSLGRVTTVTTTAFLTVCRLKSAMHVYETAVPSVNGSQTADAIYERFVGARDQSQLVSSW